MSIELDHELQKLQERDWIREEEYAGRIWNTQLRHALTQEAAYGSVLIKRRHEYHRRVGRGIREYIL